MKSGRATIAARFMPHRNRPLTGGRIDLAMVRFMTLDLADGARPALLARGIAMAGGGSGYGLPPHVDHGCVVTPNVDHVVKLMDGRAPRDTYDGADLKICDSRVLAHLARLRGVRLPVYPGSDLTADLLAAPAAEGLKVAVFGPDRAA